MWSTLNKLDVADCWRRDVVGFLGSSLKVVVEELVQQELLRAPLRPWKCAEDYVVLVSHSQLIHSFVHAVIKLEPNGQEF